MINTSDIPLISSLLSKIFFYGYSHFYSPLAIEEKIIHHQYFLDLENGDSGFLIKETPESILSSIYHTKINEEILCDNPLSLWLGEAYTKLFFSFNKSFAFLFLYLPLIKAEELFPLYHEMDMLQLLQYFDGLTKKESILTLLLNKDNISIHELSTLTGISGYTLTNLTRDNHNIYQASFDTIFKISQVCDVNVNIFARKINNMTNSESYDFDKMNIAYSSLLGAYLTSYYFNLDIDKYHYVPGADIFRNGDKSIQVLRTKTCSLANVKEEQNKEIELSITEYLKSFKGERDKYILIINEYNQVSDNPYAYKDLLNYWFEKIFIINRFYVLSIGKNCYKKMITDKVKNALINRAKNYVGGDFAV